MAQYQVPDPWMTWDGRRFERELCTECIVTAMCAVYPRRDIPYVKRGERFALAFELVKAISSGLVCSSNHLDIECVGRMQSLFSQRRIMKAKKGS